LVAALLGHAASNSLRKADSSIQVLGIRSMPIQPTHPPERADCVETSAAELVDDYEPLTQQLSS
jgi:hypothetical protein